MLRYLTNTYKQQIRYYYWMLSVFDTLNKIKNVMMGCTRRKNSDLII